MPRWSRSELVTNRSSPTIWTFVAELVGERLPAVPVVLVERVLDRDDRVGGDQVGVVGDHLVAGALARPRRRTCRREQNSVAATSSASAMSLPSVRPAALTASAIRSSAARLLSRLGREAALVAEAGGQALLLQHRLERVVDLGARAQRLAEGRRADRRDHELLDVDVGVGVRAAVEDVHHRHRQQVGVGAADVAEQRQVGGLGGGPGDGERDAEDRVGAELGLVGGAVELESSPGRRGAGRRRRARRAPGRCRR